MLAYSTYLGGNSSDEAKAIGFDASGNMLVVGTTASTDFPLVSAEQEVMAGDLDVFVSKLTPDGSALMYSTYLGGSSQERDPDVAVSATGEAYVVSS